MMHVATSRKAKTSPFLLLPAAAALLLVLSMGSGSPAWSACNTNIPPVAHPRHVIFTTMDAGGQVTLTGSDHEDDALTYTVVSGPSHGSLSGTPPNLTYSWNGGTNVDDSFTFKVNDGCHDSRTVTVNIEIINDLSQSNAPGVANPLVTNTAANTARDITLSGSDSDGDALSYSLLDDYGPSHGTVSGTPPNVTYTPETGYTGADTFYYNVSDGNSNIPRRSDPAVVYTQVGSPSTSSMPPIAETGGSVFLAKNYSDSSDDILLESFCSDPAGRALTYSWYCYGPDGKSFSLETDYDGNAIFPEGKPPGDYSCYVMVTNSDGQTASDSVDVTIEDEEWDYVEGDDDEYVYYTDDEDEDAPGHNGLTLGLLALFCTFVGLRTVRRAVEIKGRG